MATGRPEGLVLDTQSTGRPEGLVVDQTPTSSPTPPPLAPDDRARQVHELMKSGGLSGEQLRAAEELERRGTFKSFIEPLAALGSSIVAEIPAGLAGIAQAVNPFAEEGAAVKAVEATREAFTYKPRTEVAQEVLGEIGGLAEPLGEVVTGIEKGLGDFAHDLTGSATIAAAAASAPTIVAELLGLAQLKSLRTGTRLLDKAGNPTKVLKKELVKKGFDYDNLKPEVKELITDEVGPDFLPSKTTPARRETERVISEQIKAGGREDSLAGLLADGERVKPDKVGLEAMKQGFRPGFVQSVKTASPATKEKMMKMVNTMRRVKKSERLGVEIRPSDIVGESITDRITFIRDSANTARKELDDIARNNLSGVDVDPSNVLSTYEDALFDLDVKMMTGKDGLPKPDFAGSLISKDRSSQRVIKDLTDLLSESIEPDALRFHKLKRQLDIMIDYNKKSASGLSDAGKGVIKQVRKSLNDSLREIDPDYAAVNDVLSTSLTTLNDLDKAVGSIDIFGAGAEKAIGTRMRALLSNQQGRVKIENAVDQINDATTKLGGKFDDDIKDLVMFADGLDAKFGTTAKTSFAGQVEQAVGQAVQSPKASVIGAAAQAVGKGAEKLRGVNDFNSFEALEKLLRRGAK